ncbi:MAG: sn-glycerol-3-phosphate ABC transporter ATP-binding protein UgpC [Acidimicrobiales bacterium]|nr:sn-glycerol-3-phosphate ABC transporter ATP-binding protein UgpC [Acidimicrobiaceae bacterium]MXV88453.1 sn-glycerol-3-phosphate ABC transporter ATP-binding protein UgpC [Acidimicrobiales bacterium]MDE0319914.1 sn-glycerol-3-phosphate ABC transporter ATP-binding protein UgpC [Acidimicrobiaceae bacterium]MXX43519.1 sn-glycerol-3-phosphate ABC transporter ATP-binding protein UgpC [Acidimicrobiales bacterium]MXZ16073.1 sn-glycerol-3-phosphate ABC transporter ATP-binding protein UgpC [Acidimicro
MATVTLSELTKVYSNGFEAVTDLSLTLDDGEFLVLVGPSGCGKSTALRMIAGLEQITSGDLYVGDRRLNDVAPKDRDIAMVFQNYALYPQMTVAENIGFPLKLRKVSKAERNEQVRQAARVLELTDYLDRKPAQLSGGQRQRVAMGRAIVRRPELFLMDEPLSNLDAKLRVQMRADIAGIQREFGVTTFYVTHDQVEAMTMGDRVAVIKDGVLQQVDSPEDLYAHPANAFVAAFIGSPSMNLYEATLRRGDDPSGDCQIDLGDQRLAVPADVVAARPALAGYLHQPIVLGFRPEHLEDAAVATEHPDNQRLDAVVDVREALGAETLVHFNLNAQGVESGDPDALDEMRDTGRCTARFAAETRARVGDRIRVNVDVRNLHFFDRQSHLAIKA